MRTTVRLDEGLLRKAKQEAARRGKTLTALIDEGLRLVVDESRTPAARKRVRIPVCRKGGGTRPGVDLSDSASLVDLMDGIE
jgi:hypothetical protein